MLIPKDAILRRLAEVALLLFAWLVLLLAGCGFAISCGEAIRAIDSRVELEFCRSALEAQERGR